MHGGHELHFHECRNSGNLRLVKVTLQLLQYIIYYRSVHATMHQNHHTDENIYAGTYLIIEVYSNRAKKPPRYLKRVIVCTLMNSLCYESFVNCVEKFS